MKSTQLVTQITAEDLKSMVTGLSSKLNAHVGSDIQASHGGLTVSAQNVYDNNAGSVNALTGQVGDLVARHVIRMEVDGLIYQIPCDTSRTGPPLKPATSGGSDVGGSYTIDVDSGIVATLPTGSPFQVLTDTPCTIAWQILLSTGWTTMSEGTVYYDGNTGASSLTIGAASFLVDSIERISASQPLSYTISASQSATLVNTQLQLTLVSQPGGDYSHANLAVIRAVISNEGGAVVSGTAYVSVTDSSPCCWFCSQANIYDRIEAEQWKELGRLEQAIFKRNPRAITWYVRQGDKLVRKMIEAGVKPDYFIQFAKNSEDKWKSNQEEAIQYYFHEVVDCIKRYWPEVLKKKSLEVALQKGV